jgi:hypothetical protein
MDNIRIHGDCHHLHTNGDINNNYCIKRYINVFDVYSCSDVKIAVCNEYMRLKCHEAFHASKYNNYGIWEARKILIDQTKQIISEHINIKQWGYKYHREHYKPTRLYTEIDYMIYKEDDLDIDIWGSIDISEGLRLIKANRCNFHEHYIRHSMGADYRPSYYYMFIDEISRLIRKNIETIMGYAKYKKHYNSGMKIMRRMSESNFEWNIDDDELWSDYTELLINVLK